MKEEIQRIMKLVQEGKLSPEDAAELIDAFQADGQPQQEPEATQEEPKTAKGDPIRGFLDYVEKLGRDVTENVNWNDVAVQIRTGAQKGVEQIKVGIDKLKDGKLNFDLFAAQEIRVVEMGLAITAKQILKVENPCGDVRIHGSKTESKVKATAKVRGIDQEEAKKRAAEYTLIIEESDHQVNLRQPDISGVSVDLEIWVPPGTAVEAKTLSGNLMLADTKGRGKVSATSGNIALSGLNGIVEIVSQSGNVSIASSKTPSLSIENRSGDVSLTDIEGNMNVRTASGDLRVVRAKGKTISIESVSGDVHVDLAEPVTGNVAIRTVNGNAFVGVTDGCDCRVSLSTLRGTVSSSLELDDESKAEQHLSGTLGEGSGTLDVSAVNGSIHLKLRDSNEASS